MPDVTYAVIDEMEPIARDTDAGTFARRHSPAPAAAEASVIAEFLAAWEATDVGRIVALLADDALLTMPPIDVRLHGPAEIGEFFSTHPAGRRFDRIGHVEAYGVMVFAIQGDRIAGITGFPRAPCLFGRFGLDTTHR